MPASQPFVLPEVSDDDLQELEVRIQEAQRRRSLDGLNALGFGEVSIALGWPTDEPRFVAKRLIPLAEQERIDGPLGEIDAYMTRIKASGGLIVPTETRRIQRPDGLHVAYVVQPLIQESQLAETVLKNETPEVGHPVLVAVRDFAMKCVSDEMAVDTQVPNFAWVDGEAWLLDVTTPAVFAPNGDLAYDTHMSKQLVPAPLRPALQKATVEILGLYRKPHGSLMQTAVFLYRIGADDWVEPAIETFNQTLDTPIELKAVQDRWERNRKDFPRIKKLLQVQRAWQEKVRRTPFEYLITDSFSGEIL